jgi:putative hydrolase
MDLCDFHTHTFHSDGELSAVELIRRAHVAGYRVIGIADHCGEGGMEELIAKIAADCALANEHWDITALTGIELTHVPARSVQRLAAKAKAAGAQYVAVHGETPVEPTEPGTNLAAVSCPDVDYLCHPGLITEAEAALAREHGVFLEITSKVGHSLTNGHVATVARAAGARLLIGSDCHNPSQLLSDEIATRVLRGAGLTEAEARDVRTRSVEEFLQRVRG